MIHLNRRRFLKLSTAAAGGLLLGRCTPASKDISGAIRGASAAVGHLLRTGHFPPVTSTEETDVVIVGGGVAGLTAAWRLHEAGVRRFVLLELEPKTGGNASWGQNDVSPYPWGAHYLPIPGRDAHELRRLLEQLGVIRGAGEQGAPLYEESYLCQAPQERLFYRGEWHTSLTPRQALSPDERVELHRFQAEMQAWRERLGADGKPAFAIPVDESSADFRKLDQITMAQWLAQNDYKSIFLHWYVNYCCRDDYGCTSAEASAWAGLHYFAARDGWAANAGPSEVLTWPEGNGWLTRRLTERVADHIRTGALAFRIGDAGEVDVYDVARKSAYRLNAKQVIAAAPQFVLQKLMQNRPAAPTYTPWLVANLTLSEAPGGVLPAWDNVSYDSPSLGYVAATHQQLAAFPQRLVLTYYLPLTDLPPDEARRIAYRRPYAEWQALVLADMETMHPGISDIVEALDVWLWGHGMARPTPGYLWDGARQSAALPQGKVFFAHSDLGGLPLFEEAFHQGLKAAEAVLGRLG